MMNLFPLLPYVNLFLAVSSLALLVLSTLFVYDHWHKSGALFGNRLKPILWPAIIVMSVGGAGLSLVYSEIFLFVPCSLCWLQRIALYPQALLAIIAYRRGDTVHFPIYGIALSAFGMIVATYQYLYQMLPARNPRRHHAVPRRRQC
jgi:hypothetical protein